jgi:hypothetical protein
MSWSPVDAQPVLDAIVESAKQLVGGFLGDGSAVRGTRCTWRPYKTDDAARKHASTPCRR